MALTYASTGVNYNALDKVKRAAQKAALSTARHLLARAGTREIEETRGESAFVWKQGNVYMASVIEGLGTKNLVADAMRSVTGKTYYDRIGWDTIASIINDLISVGATPLVLHAYWAVGDAKWLEDAKRMKDLIRGWKDGCDAAGVTWGGGETPAYAGIIDPATIDLGGSAVGMIQNRKRLLLDTNLRAGDSILLLKSSGMNVNGLSFARSLSKKFPKGYATKLPNGTMYGEALLCKTNIYAKLIGALFDARIRIHYLSNITGHGLRKIMRARANFTYVLETIATPPPIFAFLQKHSGATDREMYQTFNMGMDYAIFLPESDVRRAQILIKKMGFDSIHGGYVENGKRKVVIMPKDLTFEGRTLNVR